jgi:hypothetical protein
LAGKTGLCVRGFRFTLADLPIILVIGWFEDRVQVRLLLKFRTCLSPSRIPPTGSIGGPFQ